MLKIKQKKHWMTLFKQLFAVVNMLQKNKPLLLKSKSEPLSSNDLIKTC